MKQRAVIDGKPQHGGARGDGIEQPTPEIAVWRSQVFGYISGMNDKNNTAPGACSR